MAATDTIIECHRTDEQHHKAEDHPEPIVEDEVARRNDDEVQDHQYGTDGGGAIFPDNQGDDVSTSCRAVMFKTQ